MSASKLGSMVYNNATTKHVFFDTEFIEDSNTLDLISIGLHVGGNGGYSTFYAINEEANYEAAYKNSWVRLNVLLPIYEDCLKTKYGCGTFINLLKIEYDINDDTPTLIVSGDQKVLGEHPFTYLNLTKEISRYGKSLKRIRADLQKWLLNFKSVQLYGYYCAYDFTLFCRIFDGLLNLPDNVIQYPIDLKVMSEHYKNITGGLAFPEGSRHNALEDAILNKEFFEEICVKLGRVF